MTTIEHLKQEIIELKKENKELLRKLRRLEEFINERADGISYSCEENGEIYFAQSLRERMQDD